MHILTLFVLLLLPAAAQAQEGCYIGEHNDFVCNKLNMENIVTPPKKFEKTVPNVNTYTNVPLPPPTYYPPDDDGGTIPVANSGDVSAPPKECKGEWKVVSSDVYGWLSSPIRAETGVSIKRFSRSTAPDGSPAILHNIKKGDEIHPLGADSGVLYNKPGYCAVMLRYKMYNENNKWRTQGGKYMSIMAGRGQAGGRYLKVKTAPGGGIRKEGWSFYLLSPVTKGSKGSSSAQNGLLGGAGAANRSKLGATCVSPRPQDTGPDGGGDPIGGNRQRCFEKYWGRSATIPTGRWVTIEQVSVMNDKNKSNGAAYYAIDGKEQTRLNNVMWAIDPEASPELWVRWRMMYGGNPEDLPPAYDFKEWYKDFELLVIEK